MATIHIQGKPLETTWKLVSLLVGVSTLVGAIIASSAWAYHSYSKIDEAVEMPMFRDSLRVLHQADLLDNEVNVRQDSEIRDDSHRILGLLCSQPRNKQSDFCSGTQQ
jgi:hypothetical protein